MLEQSLSTPPSRYPPIGFQKKLYLMYCDLFKEKVVVVGQERDSADAECLYPECAIYTPSELNKICDLPEDTILGIHGLKKRFHGRIAQVFDPPDPPMEF